VPTDFFEAVRSFQREIGSVRGYVFSAALTKLDGSLWHAYRRKWAIERKHLPLKDVAAAGGWKDVSTLLEVYQQSDEESVLAVTSVTLKLGERRGLIKGTEKLYQNSTTPVAKKKHHQLKCR